MAIFKRRNFLGAAGAALALPLFSPRQALAGRRNEDAGEGVHREESKEFQLKLDVARLGGAAATDAALRAAAWRALDECAGSFADGGKARLLRSGAPVIREAIRYDTSPGSAEGLFRKHWLSLAIEATDERTKLKCKHHSLIPEMVGADSRDSVCLPGGRGGTKAKFKIEQDIHFNNVKTCASGSVFLAGRRTDAAEVSFFSAHFPGIASLCAPQTRLHAVHHWHETVYETDKARLGSMRLSTVMLVIRRDAASNAVLEAEFAYKLRKEGHGWDSGQLNLAARLYSALHATGAFQADPAIFYFLDPVASVDIRRA